MKMKIGKLLQKLVICKLWEKVDNRLKLLINYRQATWDKVTEQLLYHFLYLAILIEIY